MTGLVLFLARLHCAALLLIGTTLMGQSPNRPSIDGIVSQLNLPQLQEDVRFARKQTGNSPAAHAKYWTSLFQTRLKTEAEWHAGKKGKPELIEISMGDAKRTSEDVLVVVPLHGSLRGSWSLATLLQLAMALKQVERPNGGPVLEREVRLLLELHPEALLEWIKKSDWQTEETLLAIRLNEAQGNSVQVEIRSPHRTHGFHYLGGLLASSEGADGQVSLLPRVPSMGSDPFGTSIGFSLMDIRSVVVEPMTTQRLGVPVWAIGNAVLQVAMVDDAALLAVQAHAEGVASVQLATAYQEALEFLLRPSSKGSNPLRVAFDHVSFTAKDLSTGLMGLQQIARTNGTREMAHGGLEQLAASAQRYANRLLKSAQGLGGGKSLSMQLSPAESRAAGVVGFPNDRPGEALEARRRMLSGPEARRHTAMILDLVDGERSAWHIFEALRIRRLIHGERASASLEQVLSVLKAAKAAGVLMDGALR